MTNKFDKLIEQVLSEVLVGSAKRNRLKSEKLDHVLANPRSVKRGFGQLKRRTISQSNDQGNKNSTGRVSKNARVKPVYKTKQVSKRDFIHNVKSDYDGGYTDGMTNREHAIRGEKLRKHFKKLNHESFINNIKYKLRNKYGMFNNCIVCKKTITDKTDFFMVNDSIWKSVFPNENGNDGFIHWNCFEHNLGRKLTINDFTDYAKYPVNYENKRIIQLRRDGRQERRTDRQLRRASRKQQL